MTTTNAAAGGNEPDWNLLNQQVFADDPLAVALAAIDKGEAPAVLHMVDELGQVAKALNASQAAAVPVEHDEVVVLDAAEVDGDEDTEDDIDPDADAYLWPTVKDEKGRPTSETAQPNPEAMRTALRRAARTSAADVDILADAISEHEARKIIYGASEQRAFERELDTKVIRRRTELASEGAKRQAEHEARMAESRRRRENRAAAALERRDRALDPTSRIVRLAAAERTIPWIGVIPAFLAAVLGAINVGVSLDALSPNTHLINWLVEPLLTIPVIAILGAQILGAVGQGKANPFRGLEWSLVAVALLLNVGLHAAVDGFTPAAFVWAIVPAGLAISAHLVPKLIHTVRTALTEASVEPVRGPQSGPQTETVHAPRRSESTRTAPGPSQVSAESTPESRSDEEAFAELAEAVRDGRIDPGTGRAIDPTSAESIRRTLNVGRGRSRALRDAYAAATTE